MICTLERESARENNRKATNSDRGTRAFVFVEQNNVGLGFFRPDYEMSIVCRAYAVKNTSRCVDLGT